MKETDNKSEKQKKVPQDAEDYSSLWTPLEKVQIDH